MAMHPCPRCKMLIPAGMQYCEDCRPVAEAQAAESMKRKRVFRQRAANRRSSAKRPKDDVYTFYRSTAWRRTSRACLQAAEYRCAAQLPGCAGTACEVHHIQPVRSSEGWARRLDPDNLMPVCAACHIRLEPRQRKPAPQVVDLRKLIDTSRGGQNSVE